MLRRKHILLLLEWYDYRIHRGVAQIARENGWQLNCPKSFTHNEGILNNWKGDGCIALLQCTQTLEYFRTHKIPLVDLGLGDHNLSIPRVVTDNEVIGRLAAEHFRDHGYKEVFALTADGIKMYEERLQAFITHMEADGGKVTVFDSAGRTESKVIQELQDLAQAQGRKMEELSVGFFAFQDTAAAEMISICLKNNLRVPENIAVLGVDNDDLVNQGLSVGLSSVDSDQEGLGLTAARTLQKLLDSNSSKSSDSILRHPPSGVVSRLSTDCYAVANPLVANALHWIKNNFYHGIQATDVAEAMGVTQQGLQKAFANCYSKSPGQEIRHQRTHAVAHLLQTTEANLDEIAKNCGYYSVNSLINSFRAEHGTTPGNYRKRLKLASNA
ncbi:MAG: substrate-binding domain-containing protein [Opitutae bacterium]|jgi:LacI family transcriptional regulator|nr:substrate-binding domain-containing protein [Opitutales bacterium]MDG1668292.1 substrate-binding domain-containing protein [Opitutae bacterium]MDG2345474.1 substrate-binding domain-containing protein [Opitutae bacterium]